MTENFKENLKVTEDIPYHEEKKYSDGDDDHKDDLHAIRNYDQMPSKK